MCLELRFGRGEIHVKDDPFGCVTTTANYLVAIAAHHLPEQVVATHALL